MNIETLSQQPVEALEIELHVLTEAGLRAVGERREQLARTSEHVLFELAWRNTQDDAEYIAFAERTPH